MESLASWTPDLGTWFVHFTGSGVIARTFIDAAGNRLILLLLGIVPWSSIC